ncbi:MAG: alpha/beta hydrolase [Rhizobacter sp.]
MWGSISRTSLGAITRATFRETIRRRHHVTELGSGLHTLVFAHGFGCDQSMWRDVVPAYQDRFKVVLFDFIGSSHSDTSAYDPQRYATLNGYAQDVLDICEALDLNQTVFVGHSASAMIGALASVSQPERFAHLVMVAPSPRYINDPPDYVGGFNRADIEGMLDMMEHHFVGWADATAPVIMKNDDRPQLKQTLGASFCAMDPAIALRWARAIFLADNRKDLPQIKTPSLIVQCTDDAIAPLSVGQYMHAQLPRSLLRVMKATGHCPHMSEPEEFIGVLDRYLQDQLS